MNSKKVANYKYLLQCYLTFKEIFLNIMIKRIDTSSRFQIIGKAIPSIRYHIGFKLWNPRFVF